MNYKIIIQKKEPNPNYAAEVAKAEEETRFRSRMGDYPSAFPQEMTTTDALICELTAEQFEAIRKAVLEKF